MKKKVFRERYAKYVERVETFDKLVKEPNVEIKKPTKRGKKNDKSNK